MIFNYKFYSNLCPGERVVNPFKFLLNCKACLAHRDFFSIMLNTKKNAKSLQVNDAATLSHETATIQIPLKLKFLMEDYPNLLDVIFEMYSFNNDFSTMARSLREIIFEPMMSANNIQNYADYQTQYQDLIVLHNCFEDLEKKAAKP